METSTKLLIGGAVVVGVVLWVAHETMQPFRLPPGKPLPAQYAPPANATVTSMTPPEVGGGITVQSSRWQDASGTHSLLQNAASPTTDWVLYLNQTLVDSSGSVIAQAIARAVAGGA